VIALASLALAMLAFLGSHLLLSHPLRLRMIRALGEAAFQGVYSIVAALTLLWVILAYRGTGHGLLNNLPLWIAPGWWWPVASALMLVACILLVGSLIRNPAFPHPGAGRRPVRPATGVFAVTRHPMNWAFALWALVHLSLSGSPPNIIVAGGILVLAFLGSLGQDRKKRAALGESWRQWEARTSFVPFEALARGRSKWADAAPGWTAGLGGLALWLAVTSFHAPTVSPIVWLWQSAG
jgi:uncharacterized membrane protein